MHTHPAIVATQQWLQRFIIPYNICPFAFRVVEQQLVRYQIFAKNDWEQFLTALLEEFWYLDNNNNTETTLVIFDSALIDFEDYLDFVALAEQLLEDYNYSGIYQLASFHPDYCFADAELLDAANYSNRSPYPMLHIIREASINQALENYPNPEGIPERNIAITRKLGLASLQAMLAELLKA